MSYLSASSSRMTQQKQTHVKTFIDRDVLRFFSIKYVYRRAITWFFTPYNPDQIQDNKCVT